jgi:tetratricopeptide (TPR) repeat protein
MPALYQREMDATSQLFATLPAFHPEPMKHTLPGSAGLIAVIVFTTLTLSAASAQDPSIDKLLKKLPPPEKLVKPTVKRAVSQPDPAFRDPLISQIVSAAQANSPGRALEFCRKLSAKYPKSAGSECLRGIVALTFDQYGEAASGFRHSIALSPSLSLAHFGMAATEFFQNHYAAAIPHLKAVTRLEPDYGFAWQALSDCSLRIGRKQESVEYALRATKITPSSGSAWLQLARAQNAVGNGTATLQALTRGAEVSPDSATILATVGFGYINLNRIQEAIPPLQRAARLAPRDFLVRAQLGFCLQATGQVDAAIGHLRAAASLAPKNYGAVWEHLGLAYQKKGNHQEAIKSFERATQIMPNYRLAWRHLADEYRAVGRTADASKAEARARSAPSGKTQAKARS